MQALSCGDIPSFPFCYPDTRFFITKVPGKITNAYVAYDVIALQ